MNKICAMPPKFELELLHSIERIEIPKNRVLLERGQICDHYYYIEKGILSCHELDDAGGKEYCTWLMFPGSIATSILSFNERVPSIDIIRTEEKSVLHLLPWKNVDRFTRQSRQFAFIRQELTNKYYLQFSKMDAQRLRPPEQFFQYLETLYGDDFYRVPGKIMASHMGISETTFYEIKKNFGRDHRNKGKR
ncbi:MAG TPA: hypothetical protein VGS79_18970 [Puia sp.]|nr:hypothetical protein [Puia sp.]